MNSLPQISALSHPTDTLRPFFEPRAIAVIGASRARGKIGSEILHNLIAGGFTRTIIPIHPSAETVQGLTAYPRVSEVPLDVDLAVIAVPAAQVAGTVDDCLPGVCRRFASSRQDSANAAPTSRGREQRSSGRFAPPAPA